MKTFQMNIASSAMFFSVAVVLIWSFIPVVGYWLAKLLKARGRASKYALLSFGFIVGLFEKSLFHFDLLTNQQVTIGTVIVFFLFFIAAYITPKKA